MLTQEEGNLPVPLTHSPYYPIEIIPQALAPSKANNCELSLILWEGGSSNHGLELFTQKKIQLCT